MQKEFGYILVEIMLTLMLFSLIISLLVMINMTAIDLWHFNINRVSLQREVLISMEKIVNIINQAAAVDNITLRGLDVLTTAGRWDRLYYKPKKGLCWASDTNVISKRVVSLKFIKQSESLLIIELIVQKQNETEKLTTGIEI